MNIRRAPAQTTVYTSSPAIPSLRGRWLGLARAMWIVLTVLSVGLYLISLPIDYRNRIPGLREPDVRANLAELGLSVEFTAAYLVTLTVTFTAICCVVGIIIFARRSDEPMALLVSLLLVVWGTQFPNTTLALADVHPLFRWSIAVLELFGLPLLITFFYIFPDARFVPRWTMAPALLVVGTQALAIFFPRFNLFTASPAIGIPFTLCLFGTMLFAQVYRYRRVSGPMQRQQTKWVVFGFAVALLVLIVAMLLPMLIPSFNEPGTLSSFVNTTALYAAFLLMPLSIGGAILLHRLWDIDLIISRTLLYGGLSAVIVGLYVLVVGGLGALLQVEGNVVLSLLATGLIAVAVTPLHRWLQRGVNRLMYGDRDEPYAVISRLGQQLERTLAPDALLPTIVRTVKEALRLPHAAIELREDGGGYVQVAADGVARGNELVLPLAYQGESVGRLHLSPRAGTDGFSPVDQRLLDDLARHAGVAAHAVALHERAVRLREEALRLAADLQRSRERLVTAREEERRRLRRDLHDGLGPQMASLTLTIDTARRLLETDPSTADMLLADVTGHAQGAIADIRRLIYDLRPPALDDLGLVPALRELSARYGQAGLRIEIDAAERLPPLPAAVEVAAYRIAQEALTNTMRHAGARTCTLRLTVGEGELCVDVSDDGRGLPDDHRAGVGLRSMRERAEELGGVCTVDARPGGGTRVLARLPLPRGERDGEVARSDRR